MSNYPDSIDNISTLPTATDPFSPVKGSTFDKLRLAVLAIERELGIQPKDGFENVSDRINNISGNYIRLGKDLGGTITQPQVIGLHGFPLASTTPSIGQVLVWNGNNWAPGVVPSSGGGGLQNLDSVLGFGNITNGNDIVVSTGDVITSQTSLNLLAKDQLNGNGGDILVNAGDSVNNNGGNASLIAGNANSVGNGGNVFLTAGTSSLGTPGQIFVSGNLAPVGGLLFVNGNLRITGTSLLSGLTTMNGGARITGGLTIIDTTDINCNNVFITNVRDPVIPQDAATKNYVDNSITLSNALNTGNTTNGNNIIVSSGDHITLTDAPVNATDAVRKSYVDAKTLANILAVSNTTNGNNIVVSAGDDLVIIDPPVDPTDGVNKAYVDGYGALTAGSHAALHQLIHLADGDGPFEDFNTNSYREITGSPFPNSIIWYTDNTKAKKIVSKQYTYNGALPLTITWKSYDVDGISILATVVDTLTYSNAFEVSRIRAIS